MLGYCVSNASTLAQLRQYHSALLKVSGIRVLLTCNICMERADVTNTLFSPNFISKFADYSTFTTHNVPLAHKICSKLRSERSALPKSNFLLENHNLHALCNLGRGYGGCM